MVIIDTEFLFALNETDPKHSKIQQILEKSNKELKAPPITINGLKLRSAYKFRLFDCLIAGTAIASKELLIGDDKVFQKIKELEWKNYSSFIKFLAEKLE
ncbi:MAG: hypothetical protein ACTSRS_11585 [Candidatus Helarchaeota archaeon]